MAAELTRDLGPPFAAAWRSLVDAHGPKQAARVFARVLAHVEHRGVEAVAATISTALERSEPLLLALAPAAAPPIVVDDNLLPVSLRDLPIEAGRASDYDALLGGRS